MNLRMLESKNVVIIEGPDASGKSRLSKYLQDYVGGKCHVLHSNFDKKLPKESHFNQHKLMADFIHKQFSKKYYTGNRLVILDRNYISDIVYGSIGYGSQHTRAKKVKKLFKFLNKIKKNALVSIIYCRPTKTQFDDSSREELLNSKEDKEIQKLYDSFFNTVMVEQLISMGIKYYKYSYDKDPNYEQLTKRIAMFSNDLD